MNAGRLGVAAAIAAAAVTGALVGAHDVVADESYTDPAGDVRGSGQPPAPDLTAVHMSNDPEAGTFHVDVTAIGLGAPSSVGRELYVPFDADSDYATGSNSFDSALIYTQSPAGSESWDVWWWNGSAWEPAPRSAVMAFTRSGDTVSWSVSPADLAFSKPTVRFWVHVTTRDAGGRSLSGDAMPNDNGDLSYTLVVLPRAVIGSANASPKPLRTGRRGVVRFAVSRNDTGAPFTRGSGTTRVIAAGTAVPHVDTYAGGSLAASFVVPKRAKGRLLTVQARIVDGDRIATRSAVFRVSP